MSTTSRVPLQLPLLPASDLCQRWREQRVVWRHRHAAGETFIPRGYEVAPIGRPQTAEFLRDHHYLHKLPANRFRFGLLHGVDLVGIAVLGPGMPHTLRALFPDLEPAAESLVLDRFALLDDVKALGETWFLARVFALLRSAGIEAVATFSDPWPRRDRHGRSVHVGHIGTVFQAASAIYTGLTARETFHQLDTGELVHRRALSKLRNGERSSHYLETLLLGVGAPPRSPSEWPDAWLDRVLPLVSSPYAHGGNHRYAFLIGRHRPRVRIGRSAQPYPKQRTPSLGVR